MASSRTIELDPALKGFPVEHYSYSALSRLSTNPFMFKVNYMNGDRLDSTTSPMNALGRAAHRALEAYLLDLGETPPEDDGHAILAGHRAGIEQLKAVSDGMIEFNTTIPNRAKLDERFAFAYFGYVKAFGIQSRARRILMVERMLHHKVVVDGKELPVPLKGSADLVYEDMEGRIRIEDHKFGAQRADPEAIDGDKLLQAAINYLLVHAETGRTPYSMLFRQFKVVENRDRSEPQAQEIEIVFEKHPLIFDFFFRFYEDATNALLGRQVFLPNMHARYDRDVSILAYIHRLDIDEERDKAFRKLKVDNLTDFLKKRIQSDGAMREYLDVVAAKFVSAKSLNYKDMTTEEKIKMKLAEHGLAVEFHSRIDGGSVTQYRFEPSIGLKMTRIEAFAKDVEQVVETEGVRVLAPIPNTGLVGFEVPKTPRTFPGAQPDPRGFEVPLGVDIMGEPVFVDLREAPHVLIAGATGSGKSVTMSSIIKSVLKLPNTEVHLMDPKMVELVQFRGQAASYTEELDGIKAALIGFTADMDQRYKVLQKAGVRNIRDLPDGHPMRYRFLFIDEFADLMIQAKHVERRNDRKSKTTEMRSKGVKVVMREGGSEDASLEDLIIRLAQKGRAAGIHIVMATQRPTVNVVNGTIKANFPMRVALQTATSTDSNVILDQEGAETLLGKGDMLVMAPGVRGLIRLQGYNV